MAVSLRSAYQLRQTRPVYQPQVRGAYRWLEPTVYAPPVFVTEYETAWTTNTTPKTVSVTVNAGDVLVVGAASQDSPTTISTPTGGTGITWELRQSIVLASRCPVYVWTTKVDTGQTFTLSVARGATSGNYGFNCLRFSNSVGIGGSAQADAANAAPAVDLLTNQDRSAIVVFCADWNAGSGTRTWRTGAGALSEVTYVAHTTHTAYGGYHADSGAGQMVHTVGLSAPATQNYSLVAVEVFGAPVLAPAGPSVAQASGFLPFFA
jgi:hypothetical protein